MIVHQPELRLWVLSGPTGSYVLWLDEEDRPLVLHWGPRLTAEQAASLLDLPRPGFWPVENTSEGMADLAAAGGLRYGAAGLQVRFPDGTRDLELAFTGESHTEDTLVLTFADRHYPLTVESHYRLRGDVIERHLVLRNAGEPVTLARADSATWVVPPLADYRLGHVHGRWGAETQLTRVELPYGETVLTSRRGVTSHHANPWAMIDDGTATEEHGAVYSCALAWSGSWRLTAQRLPTGRVTLSAGFGHDPVVLTLEDELVTPVCAGMYSQGGFGAASRAWHDYQLRHVLPHPGELRPVLYNSWEATGFDLSLDGQIALAERAAAMGVELFVMDDGWFGARTHDAAGLGDWYPNPARFPEGLAPLIARVHELGMRFGLWVEPEMVNPDSELYRAHPDWVIHQPHRRRTEHRNQLVLNLARPEVAEHLHRTLDELLAKNAIDFVKWDMNRPFTEAGQPGSDDHDRLWIGHVRALYAILDRLREAHPHARFESCSSGGGRVDLGILSRTDQVWTSDNTDALDRVEIQHGFSQLYPTRVMAAWVTDSPNPITGRELPLDFRFHVAMAGVLGVGGSLDKWTDGELARAAELVADYKRIRPIVQHGLQYRLAHGSLTGVQYVLGEQTAVLAFRTARRFAQAEPPLALRGLDPLGRYRDIASGREYHGAVLLTHGIPLGMGPGDYASTMIHLVREA
ncbi:alpha-galactosidase [Sphaerisporangium fuscum]|uniref:alpha-galactosidase n=1 Tax=Sphaerisporangium fuscum TaxID=2835868 RepID=UPI001BDD013E|nr:alpha-galactosidase [Sphaerisporangium fuscum]